MQEDELTLYHVPLSRPTAVHAASVGSFSGPKRHSLLLVKGPYLELHEPDETGKLVLLAYTHTFSTVRAVAPLRLPGSRKDLIVVASDSGQLSILEYSSSSSSSSSLRSDVSKGQLRTVRSEPYGRSGLRRNMPGEYVAVDPRGRAIMLAGLQSVNLVYLLSRSEDDGQLHIGSPLESTAEESGEWSHSVCVSLVALDTGFDNPRFVALETIGDAMRVVLYEVDLGLHQLERRAEARVPPTAHRLQYHPEAGLWVFCLGSLLVLDPATLMPVDGRGVDLGHGMCTHAVVLKSKKAAGYDGWLCAMDDGRLLRYEDHGSTGTGTAPQTITTFGSGVAALALVHASLLYVAFVAGPQPHALFHAPEWTQSADGWEQVDSAPCLHPTYDLHVTAATTGDAGQRVVVAGRSGVRVLQRGVSVSELAQSELPAKPVGVWTVPDAIVVSFAAATMVLAVGAAVEQVSNSGLLEQARSVAVGAIGNNKGGLLQATHSQLRLVARSRSSGKKKTWDWLAPVGRRITAMACNGSHAVLGLDDGDVYLFAARAPELMDDSVDGARDEVGVRDGDGEGEGLVVLQRLTHRDARVTAVAISAASSFVAVALHTGAIRILSFDPYPLSHHQNHPNNSLVVCSRLAVPQNALVASMAFTRSELYVGLDDGVLMRSDVDERSGALSNSRRQRIGSDAVWLATSVGASGGKPSAVMACAGRLMVFEERGEGLPLAYEQAVDCVAHLRFGDEGAEGWVAVSTAHKQLYMVQPDGVQVGMVPVRQVVVEGVDVRRFEWLGKQRAVGYGTLGRPSMGYQLMVFDSKGSTVLATERLGDGRPLAMATVSTPEGQFVLLVMSHQGTQKGKGLTLRCWSLDARSTFRLVHDTPLLMGADGPHPSACLASSPNTNALWVGCGTALFLYTVTAQQLVLVAQQASAVPHRIVALVWCAPELLCAADVQESVFFFRAQTLKRLSETTEPHAVAAMARVDEATVVVGDKWGSLFVYRHAPESEAGASGALNAFYVGDVITRLMTTDDCMVYATVSGALGCLLPIVTREQRAWLMRLEDTLATIVLGHARRFRSKYWPVKNVVDGEFLEQAWSLMGTDARQEVCVSMGCDSEAEIAQTLEAFRMRLLF